MTTALYAITFFALILFIGHIKNRTDWHNPLLNCLEGLNRLFCQYWHRLKPTRINLPESGPAIVASNHISGLDPLLIIASSPRPLRFLIATEEYNRFGLRWLFKAVGCIPVDRSSRPEKALRIALNKLKQGDVVALFPHGKIHLDSEPERLIKGGAIWLATQADCPIIPLRLKGVKAQGHVLRPVIYRANAKIKEYALLQCEDKHICKAQLNTLLNNLSSIQENDTI